MLGATRSGGPSEIPSTLNKNHVCDTVRYALRELLHPLGHVGLRHPPSLVAAEVAATQPSGYDLDVDSALARAGDIERRQPNDRRSLAR